MTTKTATFITFTKHGIDPATATKLGFCKKAKTFGYHLESTGRRCTNLQMFVADTFFKVTKPLTAEELLQAVAKRSGYEAESFSKATIWRVLKDLVDFGMAEELATTVMAKVYR